MADDDMAAAELPEYPTVQLPIGPADALPIEFMVFVEDTLPGVLSFADGQATIWCSQWREHPEATHRLYAMWERWREVEDAPSMLHDFLRDVLDYHLPRLVDREFGSFRRCDRGHRPPERLDVRAAPAREESNEAL